MTQPTNALGDQRILLVTEGPTLTRSGINADLDAATAGLPYSPELRKEIAKAHSNHRGTSHIAVIGSGILCDTLDDQPYTRTVGTWTPWQGEPANCRTCVWKLSDILHDEREAA